jgi:hypothetical protein
VHKIFIDRFPFDYCRYKDTTKPGWFCGYKDGTYDRAADENKALELTTRKAITLVNEMRDKGYNAYCLPPIPPPPGMAK